MAVDGKTPEGSGRIGENVVEDGGAELLLLNRGTSAMLPTYVWSSRTTTPQSGFTDWFVDGAAQC